MSEMCSEKVYGRGRGWRGGRCGHIAAVVRKVREEVKVAESYIDNSAVYSGGEPERVPAKFETKEVEKPFCAQHDPERKARRESEKSAQRQRERENNEKINKRYYALKEEFIKLGYPCSLDYRKDLGFVVGLSFDSSTCAKVLDLLKAGQLAQDERAAARRAVR